MYESCTYICAKKNILVCATLYTVYRAQPVSEQFISTVCNMLRNNYICYATPSTFLTLVSRKKILGNNFPSGATETEAMPGVQKTDPLLPLLLYSVYIMLNF